MDCSGACTCENNKLALSLFFSANLVTKLSSKVYCGRFDWSAPFRSVFWQRSCWWHSICSGGEYVANIVLLEGFLDLALNFGIHHVAVSLDRQKDILTSLETLVYKPNLFI